MNQQEVGRCSETPRRVLRSPGRKQKRDEGCQADRNISNPVIHLRARLPRQFLDHLLCTGNSPEPSGVHEERFVV